MKWLIYILLALTAAVSVALFTKDDSGYVMLAYGRWSIEMSVVLLIVLIAAIFAGLYYTIRFLVGLKEIPGRARGWQATRKGAKANDGLSGGVLALAEGKWKEAERTLIKFVDDSQTPILNYLAAARAAHNAAEYKKRDAYLQQAQKITGAQKKSGSAAVAVTVMQAELQFLQGQFDQSLALLEELRKAVPKNNSVMLLLVRLYKKQKDWEKLRDLLPDLRKKKVVADDELYPLTIECHYELLLKAGHADDVGVVLKAWEGVPREYRTHKKLIMVYCQQLLDKNSSEPAESLLNNAINKAWDTELVYMFGQINGANAALQLKHAEAWLVNHDKDPDLMLSLGRLCLRNQLWGKAKEYLEISIHHDGRPEAYYILARLLESLGDKDTALDLYQQGLGKSVVLTDIVLPKQPEPEDVDTPHRLTIIKT